MIIPDLFDETLINEVLDPENSKHRLVWTLNTDKINKEKRLNGCYVIATDVDHKTMNTEQVVSTYKSLGFVDQAFITMKTHLRVRPVFHKIDSRIYSHLFICMLSYYLQWHMRERLKPLFAADGKYKYRRWKVKSVIQTLANLTRNQVSLYSIKIVNRLRSRKRFLINSRFEIQRTKFKRTKA